jgi:hypothetical protein
MIEMKSLSTLTLVICLCLEANLAKADIGIYLESPNTSQSIDDFQWEDLNCPQRNGTIRLQGGQKAGPISICEKGESGDIKVRNPNLNNDWVNFSFLKNGEVVRR